MVFGLRKNEEEKGINIGVPIYEDIKRVHCREEDIIAGYARNEGLSDGVYILETEKKKKKFLVYKKKNTTVVRLPIRGVEAVAVFAIRDKGYIGNNQGIFEIPNDDSSILREIEGDNNIFILYRREEKYYLFANEDSIFSGSPSLKKITDENEIENYLGKFTKKLVGKGVQAIVI